MLARTLLIVFVLLSTSHYSFAQALKLSGKVVNDKSEPLAGVSINVTGGGGTTSNVDGAFALSLTPGKKYEVAFTAVGYAPKSLTDVEVIAGGTNEINVTLQTSAKDLGGVTVTARSSARRETVNSLIAFQRNTNTVAQVVSAEAIRRSPDRSTGEVLKRVPGTSVQDGK